MGFDSKNNIDSFSWYRPDIDGLRAIAVLCVVFFMRSPNGCLVDLLVLMFFCNFWIPYFWDNF